ncbi:hypothetical protein QSV08_06760 [Maribacter sp. BPC-D8]|uniref:hypothetical protein n=1 Tax=Maribacter sp. BPC-D8 TaxID=3053613 RepID=UPI002B46F0BD|nr:hypothetical protein [Maribacter sp. BPC-D8]WRI30943.1 hypothetical protein QSV08_06760 [Maribacter sp. BPC-D8]
MKKLQIIILVISICFSCKNNSNKNIESTTNNSNSEPDEIEIISDPEADVIFPLTKATKKEKVTVVSVEEALIMPSDYLTTAMTVKTVENKQLVFLDSYSFKSLVGKEITIEYEIIPGSKLLVCFNCSSYSKEIQLYDITAWHTEIEYVDLQLKKYVEDEYIIPSSTFEMLDKTGETKIYHSNDNEMILDSVKMKSSFYSYGIVTKMHPNLKNRAELELLIK